LNKGVRTLVVSVLVVFAVIIVMQLLSPGGLGISPGASRELSASELSSEIRGKNVETMEWQGDRVSGVLMGGKRYEARVFDRNSPAGRDLYALADENNVKVTLLDPPIGSTVIAALSVFILPLLLFLAIWLFFIRPAQQGGNQAMSFGRSKARRVGDSGPKITFDDVAGIEEAKQELFEIVDFLKNTKKYVALGAKIPKGILLTGPPGVGKTHLARAIAGEAGVPFFHISGSDFVEMFVGVGAARVRDLFETAKAHRPCLIFVDEIDAVGRQRGAGLGGGHDEREQTLNQLLVEMDGFDPNSGVILIAATNRPDVLDPALLRPGRFDRQLVVDPPDAKGREAILKIHSKGKPFDHDVDMETIAKRTPGFTGADLANALNESALLAARRNQSKIAMHDIEEALDRVMVGPARRSRVPDAKEREVTAYHEAGHAVVGELLEHCDPIHKVTILPRGMALGVTWSLPEIEKMTKSKSELLDLITMALGGLVAEEVVYGERWTGASNDLERVTRIARAMVCEFGMSSRIGTLSVGRRKGNPFLGRDYIEERDYSEEIARMIDEEVRAIVDRSHQRATELLTQHRPQLDNLVQVLLERETISREEFLAVLEQRPIPASTTPPAPPMYGEAPEEEKDPAARVVPPRLKPDPA
jgi:cell division protease FtsH